MAKTLTTKVPLFKKRIKRRHKRPPLNHQKKLGPKEK